MDRKKLSVLWIGMMSVLCTVYLFMGAAEAGRLGGGRSFGSRPSYQRSAPAPSAPQRSINQPSQQNPTAVPSPMGRWGGMFGGLIAGSLIGSLLFGGGMHGVGGFGMLDLLILGGVLYLLLRFLRSRRTAADTAPIGGYGSHFQRSYDDHSRGSSGDSLSADPISSGDGESRIPPGFNVDEFMKGAKVMYTRLQSAWDKRDLDDIRQFTSPEVYAEIKGQAAENPHPGKTELLLINPRLLEVRTQDGQSVASVFYDVMLREEAENTTKQVREIWHFSREENQPGAFWVLDGIQQVDG